MEISLTKEESNQYKVFLSIANTKKIEAEGMAFYLNSFGVELAKKYKVDPNEYGIKDDKLVKVEKESPITK